MLPRLPRSSTVIAQGRQKEEDGRIKSRQVPVSNIGETGRLTSTTYSIGDA